MGVSTRYVSGGLSRPRQRDIPQDMASAGRDIDPCDICQSNARGQCDDVGSDKNLNASVQYLARISTEVYGTTTANGQSNIVRGRDGHGVYIAQIQHPVIAAKDNHISAPDTCATPGQGDGVRLNEDRALATINPATSSMSRPSSKVPSPRKVSIRSGLQLQSSPISPGLRPRGTRVTIPPVSSANQPAVFQLAIPADMTFTPHAPDSRLTSIPATRTCQDTQHIPTLPRADGIAIGGVLSEYSSRSACTAATISIASIAGLNDAPVVDRASFQSDTTSCGSTCTTGPNAAIAPQDLVRVGDKAGSNDAQRLIAGAL